MNFFKSKIMLSTIFSISVFFNFFLESSVIESDQMSEVLRLADHSKKTLVVFDIDNTLIVPENPAFQLPNVKGRKHLLKDIVPKWSKEEFSYAISLMGLEGFGVLLDQATPSIIEQLQDKNIYCVALTALNSGSFFGFEDTFSHRASQLLKHGIDFSKRCLSKTHLKFIELEQELGQHPEGRNGILFSNGEIVSKADVLLAYMKHSNFKPDHIIFIDDTKEHVETMSKTLDLHNIPNVCIHYRKIHSFIPTTISDEELVEQWRLLDEKAKKTKKLRSKI